MRDSGFTLVEVLTALAILVVGALSMVQVLSVATISIHESRVHTASAVFAAQRLEQLLALEWSSDADGNALSDLDTNLAVTPAAGGGPGLSLSPPFALEENVPGYVDYLDRDGTWLSASSTPPAGAAYVRRWSIAPPADGAVDTLVLRVMVRSLAADVAGARGARGEVRLVTLRTRMVR